MGILDYGILKQVLLLFYSYFNCDGANLRNRGGGLWELSGS